MTPIQSRLLRYLIEYHDQHYCVPSYDEIAMGMGFASKSGVHRVLAILATEGWIVLPERGARSRGARGLTILKRPLWLSPYGTPALEALSNDDLLAFCHRACRIYADLVKAA